MRKFNFVFSVALTAIFIFMTKSSDVQAFDTIKTLASSSIYNYKNPTFEFKRDDLSSSSFLAYERYNGAASDIIVRKFTFTGYQDEAILTTSTGEQNINPVISGNFVFWQSNKNGNWDLFYSLYSGSNWSAPAMLSNTSANEINPYVMSSYSSPVNSYYLVFERAGDIFLRKYRVQNSSWDSLEINLTDSISENCSNPKMTAYSDNFVYFAREVSAGQNKISARRIKDQNTFFEIYPVLNYDFLLSDKIFNISKYWGGLYFTFSSGNPSDVIGLYNSPGAVIDTFTKRFYGSHTNGKGSLMGIVTDAAGSFYFSGFGCVTKSGDSTYVGLIHTYFGQPNVPVKKIYLGNDSVQTKLDLSVPVVSGNLYKIRAVWEQKINDKTALVESFFNDFIGEVTNTETPVMFILEQNYPNPFNPTTKINYELKITNYVSLKVFDLLGKEVAVLVNGKQNAGSYAVDFNSTEFNLPSGIYFYTLNAGEFKETRKMVLVK